MNYHEITNTWQRKIISRGYRVILLPLNEPCQLQLWTYKGSRPSSFWYAIGDCMALRKSRCVCSIVRKLCSHSARDSPVGGWQTYANDGLRGSVLRTQNGSTLQSFSLSLSSRPSTFSSKLILLTWKNWKALIFYNLFSTEI